MCAQTARNDKGYFKKVEQVRCGLYTREIAGKPTG